jgi:hypothetical protein
MATMTRGGRRMTGLLCISAVLALLAGCARGTNTPVLTRAELVAKWVSPSGASMTFFADHQFTASGLNLSAEGGNACSDVTGTGTWQFLSPQGVSGHTLTRYAKGSVVQLGFNSPVPSGCDAGFSSYEINPPVGLCLDLDPDSPCTGEVFTKKG